MYLSLNVLIMRMPSPYVNIFGIEQHPKDALMRVINILFVMLHFFLRRRCRVYASRPVLFCPMINFGKFAPKYHSSSLHEPHVLLMVTLLPCFWADLCRKIPVSGCVIRAAGRGMTHEEIKFTEARLPSSCARPRKARQLERCAARLGSARRPIITRRKYAGLMPSDASVRKRLRRRERQAKEDRGGLYPSTRRLQDVPPKKW